MPVLMFAVGGGQGDLEVVAHVMFMTGWRTIESVSSPAEMGTVTRRVSRLWRITA